MSLLRITAGIISQPASGSPLRPPWPTGPSLRAGYSVRSSPPLRPDPPVSPAPPDFTSSAYTGGPARQLGLGCERHLPCFGSVFLPHVPSPLRREENQGPIPTLRPCSMAFPTKTVSRLLQCSRHRLPSGPFSRRFFRCSLCYGPRGCSPSWTDPTLRDTALPPPRTFPRALPRKVTLPASRISLHGAQGRTP